jgi:hypothetical protein
MALVPQNKPSSSSWLDRHQGTIVKGALIGGGVVIGGVVVYELANFIVQSTGCPSCGVPACQALQNSLATIDAQIGTIYYTASHSQGGTFTAGQKSSLSTLYQQQASIISQMQTSCPASTGAQASQTLDQIVRWAGWVAIGLLTLGGIYIGALGTRWFIRKLGGSKSDPGTPPKSIDDLGPPEEATNPAASFGQTVAGADLADQEANGVPASTISDIQTSLAADDPAIDISTDIATFYSSVAASAESAWITVYEILDTIWEAITTTISDLYADLTLFLTGVFG